MTEKTSLYRIAAVQMDPRIGDPKSNLEVMVARLKEAAAKGARLIIFPECALTGYGFETKAEAMEHAEPAAGPSSRVFASECRRLGVWTIFGFLESDGDRLFNACELVGPEGTIANYRKIHLPYLGVDRFATPGDRPFAVHDAGGLKVGMHICYDGSFPESGRVLSLLGAELLVLPTNWPTHSESAAEHMMSSRALENVVYTVAVNRVGEERGFRFIGRSSIIDTTGDRLAFASVEAEEILYGDLDPARARRKRLIRVPGKHEIDRIADRRPGFYEPIVRPNGKD